MIDEQLLLDEIRNGNKEAYNQMFMQYYSPLCEYASQFVGDTEAEDIIQDLMLYIWENRKNLVVEKSLKSYLFTSVKNRCYNAVRNNRLREQINTDLYEALKDRFEEPDYYLFNELAIEIDKAIENLPDNYRETFKMSRYGELPNAEIAAKLNVSVKTVEYRITQSLKILRTVLKDYLP